jgi:hypothetical protein
MNTICDTSISGELDHQLYPSGSSPVRSWNGIGTQLQMQARILDWCAVLSSEGSGLGPRSWSFVSAFRHLGFLNFGRHRAQSTTDCRKSGARSKVNAIPE